MRYLYETDSLYLRALDQCDVDILFNIYNDKELLTNFLNPWEELKPPSRKDVADWVANLLAAKDEIPMMLVIKDTQVCIGMLIVRPEYISRVGGLAIILDGAYRGMGYGTQAIKIGIHIMFNNLNMRKISFEVFSFNKARILYERLGFTEEAVLKDHIYRNGKYYDIIHLCMWNPIIK